MRIPTEVFLPTPDLQYRPGAIGLTEEGTGWLSRYLAVLEHAGPRSG